VNVIAFKVIKQKMLTRRLTQSNTTTTTPYDKPIVKETPLVNESIFALLFCEIVRYAQGKSASIGELEDHLHGFGFETGKRCLELIVYRERPEKRDVKIVSTLQFITSVCWSSLFGHNADSLERSSEGPDTYLIHEKDPLPCRYASVPKDLGNLNLASFNAGIIRGLLDAQGFPCTTVTAHFAEIRGVPRTVYVCKFPKEILERESR
jgi:hypothetical protein